jgi:N-methylhydantoinase A/oxoprolinase/acetone carboxylase beta subunit
MALLAFGGAGPLHAIAIAEELGMGRVLVPQASGVLSALGLVVSERRRDLAESVLLRGPELTSAAVAAGVERLAERGRRELGSPHAGVRAEYDLRYAGQAFELTVAGSTSPDPGELRRDFERAHSERYGYSDDQAELELVTLRVAVFEPGAELGAPAPVDRARVSGPTVLSLPQTTVVVPPGWGGVFDHDGTLVLERS